jgi:hypothetical protein
VAVDATVGSGSGSGSGSFEAIVLIAMFADSSLMFVFVEPLLTVYLEPRAFHLHRHNLNIANIQTSPNKNVYNILFSFILLLLNHWIAFDSCIMVAL